MFLMNLLLVALLGIMIIVKGQQTQQTDSPFALGLDVGSVEEAKRTITQILQLCDRPELVDPASLYFRIKATGQTYDCSRKPETETTPTPTVPVTTPNTRVWEVDGTVQVFRPMPHDDRHQYQVHGAFVKSITKSRISNEETVGNWTGGSIELLVDKSNNRIVSGKIKRMVLRELSNSTHRAFLSNVDVGLGNITNWGSPYYTTYPGDVNPQPRNFSYGFLNDTSAQYFDHIVKMNFSADYGFEPKSEPACGVKNYGQSLRRIVHGNVSTVHEFPWFVQLKRRTDEDWRRKTHYNNNDTKGNYCGGSLISRRLVLTAENCIRDRARNWTISNTTSMILTFGKNLITRNIELFIPYSNINPMARGEPYDCSYKNPLNNVSMRYLLNKAYLDNLALILMKEPIEPSFYVDIICLPPLQPVLINTSTIIFGTGFDRPLSIGVEEIYKQNAPLKYFTSDLRPFPLNCTGMAANETSALISLDWAIHPNESHDCVLDNGDPWAVIKDRKKFHLIGIVNFGIHHWDVGVNNETLIFLNITIPPGAWPNEYCLTPSITMGANVTHFLPWITKHMREYPDPE